ncbi:MAG: hypothetical protein H7Z71_07370 [Moraxellaceae bacterium]|nr:hypothetical protein [Pseudobdellovibrionaceae bacterium]
MLKSLYWSVRVFRRHFGLFAILSFLISTLVLFSATQVKIAHEKSLLVDRYQSFPFDLVSPKGSDIEILENFLARSQPPQDYLPSNLFNSLKDGPVKMIGLRTCGQSSSKLVCASLQGSLQPWISSSIAVEELKDDEVLISENNLKSLGFQIGDTINFVLPENLGTKIQRKIHGTFQSSVAAFEHLAISNAAATDLIYKNAQWPADQIWKSDVLNLILVQGDTDSIKKLSDIINKRTVSFFINSQNTLNSAIKIFDVRSSVQSQNLYFGLIATAAALFLLTFFIRERLSEFLLVTRRLGYSKGFTWAVIGFNFLYCAGLGLVLYFCLTFIG